MNPSSIVNSFGVILPEILANFKVIGTFKKGPSLKKREECKTYVQMFSMGNINGVT